MAFRAAMPTSSRPSSVSKIPLWRNGVAEPVSNKFERQSDIFKGKFSYLNFFGTDLKRSPVPDAV